MLKVMLIDDEERILRGLARLVDWNGANFEIVGMFSDSIEAVEQARTLRPDLIITDIEMPELNGLRLIDALRYDLPSAVFIILSAHDRFSYAQKALSYGVFRYILKPVSPRELLDELDAARKHIGELTQSDSAALSDEAILRHVIIRETVYGGLVRPDHKQTALYARLQNEFCFRLLFLHIRPPLDDGQYKPLSEAEYDSATAFCTDVTGYTAAFRSEDTVVIVLEAPELSLGYDTLAQQLCAHTGHPVTLGMSGAHKGLSGAHGFFRASHDVFKRLSFYRGGTRFFTFAADEPQGGVSPDLRGDALSRLPELLAQGGINGLHDMCDALKCALERSEPPIDATHVLYRELMDIAHDTARMLDPDSAVFPDPLPRLRYLSDYHDRLRDVLMRLVETCAHPEADGMGGLISLARLFIHENFSDPDMSLQQLTDKYHTNYSYFSYIFKKRTGTTFSAYLMRVRIDEAKRMLAQTGMSASDIAQRVGFQDGQSFYYAFKKACGETPKEFRQNNK